MLRIEGCVSGTLMFVLSEVSASAARSRRPCARPWTRGYAEPDPRDDLSGRDAARKGLILARMIGLSRRGAGTRDDLVPRSVRDLPLTGRFSNALPELDDAWRQRVADRSGSAAACFATWYRRRREASHGAAWWPSLVEQPMGAAAGTRNIISVPFEPLPASRW